MKTVAFHDIGDIRLDDRPESQIKEPTDAIVLITASAICGTDGHSTNDRQNGSRLSLDRARPRPGRREPDSAILSWLHAPATDRQTVGEWYVR